MLITSPSPGVDLLNSDWPSYFMAQLSRFSEHSALINGHSGHTISYAELKTQIEQAAAALQLRGYEKGDVITMYAPNSLEFVIAFHAVLKIGAVVNPANPMYTSQEITHQIEQANAVCLLTTSDLYTKVAEAVSKTRVRESILLDSIDKNHSQGITFNSLLREGKRKMPAAVKIDPEDLAVLPFSSGTTGLPKGVMLSHQALVSHNLILEAQNNASIPGVHDRVIATLPFFHIYGISVIMNLGLTHGASLVVMSNFEPRLFLTLMQDYQITRAYLVPPIMLFLAKSADIDNYNLEALEYVCCGAAPLGKETVMQVAQRLDCRVIQGYGMTEMSPATHFTPDLGVIKPASIGVLIPNTEAKLINSETGEELGYHQPGELLVKGPQMMQGYLNDTEATAKTIDKEGWLHTGDIGYVDEDGYFYIVDRLKEFIKYKGYQVAPAELEAILITHPNVADAAVVPFQDKEAGEIPKAFVVRQGDLNEQDLINWLAEQVAPFKKVRAVEFTDQIPKSPSGKILRRMLKQV